MEAVHGTTGRLREVRARRRRRREGTGWRGVMAMSTSTLLQQTHDVWLQENFHVGIDGEVIWPKACCRPFAQWLAEDVQLEDRDVGDEH